MKSMYSPGPQVSNEIGVLDECWLAASLFAKSTAPHLRRRRGIPVRTVMLLALVASASCSIMIIESVAASSAVFVSVAMAAIFCVRGELSHPYTWFIPVFSLYSLSAPNLGTASYLGPLDDLALDAVQIQFVALVGFILGALPVGVRDLHRSRPIRDKFLSPLALGAKPLLVLSGGLSFVFITAIARLDTTKAEIALAGPALTRTQFAFSFLLLAIFALVVNRWISVNRVPLLFWLTAAGWFFLISAVSSERDILLRFLLVSILVYHMFVRKIRVALIAALGFGIVLIVGIQGAYRDSVYQRQSAVITAEAVIDQSLGGEFSSASQNLMVLLQGFQDGRADLAYGRSFVDDVVHVFTSGSILGNRQELAIGGAWFNRTFFPTRYALGGGSGFTLVGEGYLNFGHVGVAMLFGLIGLSSNWFHRRTERATVALLYALMIPGVLYSIRGDLATLLAYTVKQIVIPAALLIISAGIILGARASTRGFTIKL